MELFGSPKHEAKPLWQDREIRFDASAKDLQNTLGEFIIDALDGVEDTKGNNGDLGDLRITNLRIVWTSKRARRTNISIGLHCVATLNIRSATSRLKGPTQAIFVLTKFHNQRFEFIFTTLANPTSKLFTSFQAVLRAYDASRLYRELKLRGALVQDKELKLLPQEQTYSRVNGVWNLSSEQGNLGTFFISSVRVVWYANLAENFNVSIPYLQVRSVKIRDSKFGQALVIETSPSSGGYILGFKIDPKETLDYVYKEITSVWQVYVQNPVYGVDASIQPESQLAQLAALRIAPSEEDIEIDGTDRGDALSAYFADARAGTERGPTYCAELGLAVEQLKDGMTIEQLWSVL